MLNRRSTLVALAALAARPAMSQTKISVAGVFTVPFEHQWASRIHMALQAAQSRGDIDYKASENTTNADYERVMRDYANSGAKLIVGEAFAIETAARRVAKDLPNVDFLMGSSGKPQASNFGVFDNYIQEPAYLTGMLAGGLTKKNKIGIVGGFPIPEVNRLMNAFMAGAREVNPSVQFSISFINSWFDPAKAKESAFAMVDQGADVLYAERPGVTDAAKERNILAIGNVVNSQPMYPNTIVSSALWHMEPTINEVITQIKGGTFKGEDYAKYSTMKYKGASLAPLGTFEDKVPADLKAKVAAKQAAIIDGSFAVKVEDGQPKA